MERNMELLKEVASAVVVSIQLPQSVLVGAEDSNTAPTLKCRGCND